MPNTYIEEIWYKCLKPPCWREEGLGSGGDAFNSSTYEGRDRQSSEAGTSLVYGASS